MKRIVIPEWLVTVCNKSKDRKNWLESLPGAITNLEHRWELTIDRPFEKEASCSWVAPAKRQDGTSAVLKFGMPHMEAKHEIDALRFLDGNPTVRILEADIELNAMLLESCEPGTPLRVVSENEQDHVSAKLLQRFWRIPPKIHPFRPLSEMIDYWIQEPLSNKEKWTDRGLVQEGLNLYKELSKSVINEVLLATDLHAGNVLRAHREPWLVIDPKPFLGDPAYDATQHLLNCEDRLRNDPGDTIRRFTDMLELEYERVSLWTFARVAVDSYDEIIRSDSLARLLAP